MGRGFDPAKLNRELRAAQRKAEADFKREVDRYNRQVEQHNRKVIADHNREAERVDRENQRRVDAHNHRADQHNRKVIADHNRDVDRVDAHNRAVVGDLDRQLRTATSGPRYTPAEQQLADRVQQVAALRDDREWDLFLSYARIDGAQIGEALQQHLEALGVSVWFDAVTITPGKSQARQMDVGLQAARAGVVVLTPAFLAGRFWTERELGALLHKDMLIPVLHNVTFADVAEFSGILPDLAGFETASDSVDTIAKKVAAAIRADASTSP